MTDTISIPAPQKSPAVDEFAHLRDAARSAASWDVVHRPLIAGTFRERIIAARRALKLLEVELASLPAVPLSSPLVAPLSCWKWNSLRCPQFHKRKGTINGYPIFPRFSTCARTPACCVRRSPLSPISLGN